MGAMVKRKQHYGVIVALAIAVTIGWILGSVPNPQQGQLFAAYIPPTDAQPVVPSGTFSVSVQNTAGVQIFNTPAVQGSVSINNTPGVIIQNTIPVSFPTSTLGVSVANTIGVQMFNTPAIQGSVSINNTPAVQGSVSINNTPGVKEQNTVGVQMFNTPAVQGSVSINNTPAVQGSVSINNTPAVLIQGTPAIQGSVSINNTPAVQGSVSINNTPAIQGSVSINNTPAVQGSVSINNTPGVKEQNTVGVQMFNTPAVLIQGTPAIQGSVSINNTPAVVIASALATFPVTFLTPVPISTSTIVQPFNSLVQSGLSAFAYMVLSKLPTSYWRMGEASGNLADSSGNGNTATQTGSGKTYGVLSGLVDDTNTSITMPGNVADYYTTGTGAAGTGDTFSIMFAFKRGNSGVLQQLLCQNTSGPQIIFSAADHLNLAKNGGINSFSSTATYTDTNWHLGLFVKSGATNTLYVDGASVAGSTTNQTMAASDGEVWLGISSALSQPFTGTMDETAIWSTRALTAADATDLYNAYIERKAAPVPIATGSANFFANVVVSGTPAIQGTVSVQNTIGAQIFNTPAVQGSVSINNTPAVQGSVSINNTPAVQGSVSINNTPAMVIASALATVPAALSTSDPCENPAIVPVATPVSIASATTVILDAGSAGKQIFVCGVSVTMASGGTFQLLIGSATASAICGTPTVNLTGAWVTGPISVGPDKTIAKVTSGNKLCAVAGGAAVNAQGVINYVVQ